MKHKISEYDSKIKSETIFNHNINSEVCKLVQGTVVGQQQLCDIQLDYVRVSAMPENEPLSP